MHKKLLSLLLCILFPLSIQPALAATAPPADWAWLVKQVRSGAETITLPCDIAAPEGEGLSAEGAITIEGQGFTLTDLRIDGGTFLFKDVVLAGTSGIHDESGSPGLTLRGDGAVAVLSGTSRAVGSRSGPEGERGGDGVLLAGDKQGVILRNRAMATGGIGLFIGGAGVRVAGCEGSVLLTNDGAVKGGAGLATGGPGLYSPACAKVTFSEHSTAIGGLSPYDGGHGVHSLPCEACGDRQPMAVGGTVMLTSGVGETAGSALRLERAAPGKAPDLTLADTCVLMGGAGGTAGYALYAVNASIHYEGTPELYSGDYYAVAAEGPARLEGCEESGERETVIYLEGSQVETYPANNASQIIQTELSQISSRYVPQAVENPLAARDYLVTKYEGFTVERDSVSQASLNGKGLKITLWDGTMENRLQFLQRLCSDGAEGLRMVLIARRSELWPTVETTLAALEKLHGEGFTQLAYTSAEPVYCERILDLKALLSAVHADDAPVDRLIFGTADDCVIFVREDGARDYQEELMAEVLRPLEPLPEA